MDEPSSNLDARLRDHVRTEMHSLHRELGFTSVYVTHDQTDVMALGDRIAVTRSGTIEQLGAPSEIYEVPSSRYVADVVGYIRGLDVEWVDGVLTSPADAGHAGERVASEDRGAWHLPFRPRMGEALSRRPDRRVAHIDGFRITDVSFMGPQFEVAVERDGMTLRVLSPFRSGPAAPNVALGRPVTVGIDPDGCLAYPTDPTTIRRSV